MLKKPKYSLFFNLLVVYISLNFLLRFVFILHPITQSDFTFSEIIKVFGLGFLSDVLLFIVGSSLFWIYVLFLSNSKYKKPLGYVIFGVLCLLLLYVCFFNTILNEYGGSLPEIGISFIAIKTVLFGLLLVLPQYRNKIRLVLFSIAVFLFVLIMVQNSVSEFFFWNEFGVRYNFIAVDYLVYTNAVIGNIMESYPVAPLFTSIGIITLLISYWIVKNSKSLLDNLPSFNQKKKNVLLYSILFTLSIFLIPTLAKKESSTNVFVNEIQSNGVYKFYTAFNNSELDYNSYYKTMAINDAFGILENQLKGIKNENTIREIKYDSTELKKNVVLITVESLSEEFMTSFGNEKHITPFLDSLAKKSLHFTNMYATGNRTVRGLEAVTLCLPPSAAESIVKRKDNKNKFSTASIFKDKGYQVKYMYGGDAYFDNMDDFFGGNDYDVIDKKTFLPNEITFDNIWGVCDEDMYRKAIKEMNKEASQNKPFFNHIMTVSNHRPFTYPDGKIDIPSDAKSRNGGVKYTDYAMKQFFLMAEKQIWFKNTIFVIVADHCASSSGKTELPLEKYRIPAFIYAPGFVEAKHIPTLMSQIDLMPTLFGLLHFDYNSKFYGQDVFKEDYNPRAFIATYQDLGLIKDNVLTILSPVKQVKQYSLEQKHNDKIKPEYEIHYIEKPLRELRQDLINETVSYYQTTAYLLQNNKLNVKL